jgi:hypothetical protein
MQELLQRMSSRELTEWMCYFALEPWGEERADLRTGILSSLLANIHRDEKKRHDPFTPEDFMPYHEAVTPKPTKRNSPRTEATYLRLIMELSLARQRKYGPTTNPPPGGLAQP